jgi:hypothetical protein
MIKLTGVILRSAWLILLLQTGYAQERQYKIAALGFYNLENLFDTIDGPNDDAEFLPHGEKKYTGAIYLDKLSKLATVLSQIALDRTSDGLAIIGVSEVENRSVIKDLIKQPALAARNYQIIHYDSPDERGVDVAMLYNPKYFKPLFHESLFVELYDANKKPRYTRDILYVKGLFDGDTLHIMVCHWPSRRGGEELTAPARAKAARVCRQKTDSIFHTNARAKIIIMGDLNDDPVNTSVAVILGAKLKRNQVKPKELYNPWWDYYRKGVGSLAYNDAWNMFDQIIISHAFLDKRQKGYFFKEALIFRKPWMFQQSGRYKGYPLRTWDFNKYLGGYSDHLPTYIILLKEWPMESRIN